MFNISKSLITKSLKGNNPHCIREYYSTPYIGMAWIKKMAAIHLIASDDLKSLLRYVLIHT